MADQKTISIDALGPAQTEAKAEALGVSKGSMPLSRMFVAGMLAGAFISFGAMFFCLFTSDSSLPFAVQRAGGGACFCLGLVLVLCCGAELFTGNSLMVCSLLSRKIGAGALLRNWVTVWLGNLAGSLVVVMLVYASQMAAMNGGAVGETMVSVAASKASLAPGVIFAKGILCNVLVCLAVWIGFSARSVVDKVLGIFLPITAFVACGFEHCVANMFFLPSGFLMNSLGIGAPGAVALGGVVGNILIATLGNIVGGVAVGVAYWFAYRSREANA